MYAVHCKIAPAASFITRIGAYNGMFSEYDGDEIKSDQVPLNGVVCASVQLYRPLDLGRRGYLGSSERGSSIAHRVLRAIGNMHSASAALAFSTPMQCIS